MDKDFKMLVGNVDLIERDRIAGWAADTDFPDKAVDIEIIVNGHVVGRAHADRLRLDLRDLGIYGGGHHGFLFTFDTPLAIGQEHDVLVRFAATTQSLTKARHLVLKTPHVADVIVPVPTGPLPAPADPVTATAMEAGVAVAAPPTVGPRIMHLWRLVKSMTYRYGLRRPPNH